jgi:hypothetical protein
MKKYLVSKFRSMKRRTFIVAEYKRIVRMTQTEFGKGPNVYLIMVRPCNTISDSMPHQQIDTANLLIKVLFRSDPKCSYQIML